MTDPASTPVPSPLDLEAFSALVYAMRHRVSSPRPGSHASRSPGPYGRFAGLSSLAEDNDPRRIDLRSSITDPFETVFVRRYRQPAHGTVHILTDLSGSMGFTGTVSRHAVAAALAGGLAQAARRSGDAVAAVAAAGPSGPVYRLEATRRASAPMEIAAALGALTPSGAGLDALSACAGLLPPRPSLVFLISDFAAPLDEIRALLDRLALHDLRPLILCDLEADMPPKRFGLVHLDDLEGAGRQIAFLRPSLLRRWRAAAAARGTALDRLFVEAGCYPLKVTGQIDLDDLTEGLLTGAVPA